MKPAQIITIAILLSFFNHSGLIAQNEENKSVEKKEYLKGLTKASENELLDKQIMLDGETFPVYDDKGERIRGMKMMEAMVSGNYTPDFYMDKNKEIKAVVLRISSEEEKKMMEGIQAQMNGESELTGKEAIPFSAKDIKGNEYSLKDLRGKIIVINFWFVECKPCVIEMPELNELVKKYENKEVVFLGFATNDTPKIKSFLEKKEFLYHIIPNSKQVAADYNVSGYPTHIVIDQSSKITYLSSGLGTTTIKDIEKTIENLIKK